MIRIVLLGRTGNILFQYALGRALAEKHGVPLLLDASWYNEEGWREVSHLLKLPLKARIVRRFSPLTRILRNLGGGHYWQYRGVPFLRESESDHSFDPRFLDTPDDCVLFGYFQTANYFRNIADNLRGELLDLLEKGAGARTPDHMIQPASVAVHVRRGDYLKHPALQVCDADYFHNAIRQMREKVSGARFLIFSDDPDWCRTEFTASDQMIIDSGTHGSNPLHDLLLMSRTSHHIICNSSYSWWAAWLGQKPGQVVFMPDRWHASGVMAPISEKNPGHWRVLTSGT